MKQEIKRKCWNCEHITMRRASGKYICARIDEELNPDEVHEETRCAEWQLIGTKA